MILSTAILLLLSLTSSSFSNASSLIDTEETLAILSVPAKKAEAGVAFELEEMVGKSEEELTAWLIAKRAEHDTLTLITPSPSSPDLTVSPSGSATPIDTPSSPFSASSAKSPEPVEVSKERRRILLAFSDTIRSKDFTLAFSMIKRIPDWKATMIGCNFSVLSEISKYARSQFLGKLDRKDALDIFKPLIKGKHMKFAGGYLSALALFRHEIQMEVMTRLIGSAPTLRGYLLQASIYFKIDARVISFILSSGVLINIVDQEEGHSNVSVRGLPSYRHSRDSSAPQMSVTRRFFMSFVEGVTYPPSWCPNISPDAEVNFLLGMLESVPEECGVLRAAFETYSPEIVMDLIYLSPYARMSKYHLAHLLAKNPNKQFRYPQIEELVEATVVFERLLDGQPDLVALVFLSRLEPATQLEMMSEFLAKTKMFAPARLAKSQTVPLSTEPEFESTTGLFELPYNPADVFFLTACKWNIDDAAFAKLYKASIRISTREFTLAKLAAMKYARNNGLEGKVAILSSMSP